MKRIISLLLIAIFPLSLVNCGGTFGPSKKSSKQSTKAYKSFAKKSKYDVPVVMNGRVAAWIDFYKGRGRKHFTRHLERSHRYIPPMRKILKSHGLPQDLVYIALIESGFNAKAYSHAHASGFWQFINSTGKHYGLKNNRYLDERRDFVKATHSAARYLKTLHKMFGHWYLAAAGYNAGEGKIQRAIRKYGTKDFWKIAEGSYLARETKDYVPKYLAAMMIAKNPERFGFTNLNKLKPLQYETVKVAGTPLDLRVAAKLANTDKKTLQTLNPELRLPMTPLDRKNYTLRVPKGKGGQFKGKLNRMPKHMRMAQKEHVVRGGEDWDALAKRYNINTSYLAKTNGSKASRSLKSGQKIGIPYRPPQAYYSYRAPSRRGGIQYHKVRPGDSLWKIAKRYKVSTKKLRQWNKGKIRRHLRPGQRIAIRGGKKIRRSNKTRNTATVAKASMRYHRVKKGETLGGIANRYGVRVKQLRQWNRLGKYIKSGQKLKVGAGKTRVAKAAAPATRAKARTATASKGRTYKVRSGDSLWTIAQKHRVRVSDLKRWNSNIGRHLKPGQRIAIRGGKKAPARTAKAAPKAAAKGRKKVVHTIASGDTLWHIARKYGVKTSDIKRWNGINQVKSLRPGKKLTIRM